MSDFLNIILVICKHTQVLLKHFLIELVLSHLQGTET